MNIQFQCIPAEKAGFSDGAFDVVTACQCFFYFKHEELAPLIQRILKESGTFVILYMAWLPFEDEVAGKSEELVLKYNPKWTDAWKDGIQLKSPKFMRSTSPSVSRRCRCVRSLYERELEWENQGMPGDRRLLTTEETECFDQEHRDLLNRIVPPEFEVLHYAAMAVLHKK